MANILDYLGWRGDLPFSAVPFCDVDCLILSRLSYIPFDGVVKPGFAEPQPLADALRGVKKALGAGGDGRVLRKKYDADLIDALLACPRFCELRLAGFVNIFDEAAQEQFSALTALPPDGGAIVVFRGTDGTIVGWKEDFNMAFLDSVPAQLSAVDYLEKAAAAIPGPIRLGGHSKGGNLAVYAAAFCRPETQARIISVRNNDGPGFNEKTLATPGFSAVAERVRTYLPQSSVIGMLLGHSEDFTVVHSTNRGLYQHDMYSWEIVRGGFSALENRTNSSQFIDDTLKDWLAGMTVEQRGKMVDGLFSILEASDGRTLRELWKGKNTLAVIRAAADCDEETRKNLATALKILRGSMKKALPDLKQTLALGSREN